MPTISSDKRKKDLKCTGWINIKISGKKIAIFQNLTYQLQTQFSQLPNGQNAKFQCLSDAEFPEFFKNGLTFDPSPFLLGVMVKKPWHNFFWDTLYIFYDETSQNCNNFHGTCDNENKHYGTRGPELAT